MCDSNVEIVHGSRCKNIHYDGDKNVKNNPENLHLRAPPQPGICTYSYFLLHILLLHVGTSYHISHIMFHDIVLISESLHLKTRRFKSLLAKANVRPGGKENATSSAKQLSSQVR